MPNNHPDDQNDPQQRDLKLARFRGWSLTALYFSLALWALIFCYASYNFWDHLLEQSGGGLAMPVALLTSSIMTFLASARAGHSFLKVMQTKAALPSVDLIPFLAIAVTIVVARQAFGGI